MKRFALGFVTMLVVLTAGTVAYLLLGLAEVRADVNAPRPIRALVAMSVRASVRRHAPATSSIALTKADIVAGARLYLNGCAGCHGTPGKPRLDSTGFLPPPYLPAAGSQYTEPETYWIIKHGIRRTGMSAYGPFYKEKEILQLAAFVKRMPELPVALTDSMLRK